MKFTKLLRNKKAISPIFATLILIAIAVIAGIVVYMFTSGTVSSLTGGGSAAQEKVAIQGVDTTALVAYAQNTGSGTVVISNFVIKDSAGIIVNQGNVASPAGDLLTGGALVGVPITLTNTNVGESYTVTLVSTKGGSFVSPSFIR